MDNHSGLGPLMISIDGIELSAEDKEVLEHPAISGVIIFARNYHELDQISKLNFDIKNLKTKSYKNNNSLLISVDQEGGTVQRIKEPLTILPAMVELGKYYNTNPQSALELTKNIAWLLASELLALGFDFSFTPVVDLNLSDSKIVKTRAFHRDYEPVSKLALALKSGLNLAGMSAVAKHFPGHGAVVEDSHFSTPKDMRNYEEVYHQDLEPYKELIADNLEAIMTAHIIYGKVDDNIVTFSKFWLNNVLRQQLKFEGLIISDDLDMKGSDFVASSEQSNYTAKTLLALEAGCDLLLLCNNRSAVIEVLDNWNQIGWQHDKIFSDRLNNMRPKYNIPNKITPNGKERYALLKKQDKWQKIAQEIAQL